MIIRPSQPSDRDAILRFIQDMGFNPRDARTWDGLGMWAITACEGDDLIAALPLEPRVIQSDSGPIETVHETVVAVRPEFRSRGIGSALQQALIESGAGGAALATVYREDPKSPAYRWYIRNGFVPVMRIESWFKDEPRLRDERIECEVWQYPENPSSILVNATESAAGALTGGLGCAPMIPPVTAPAALDRAMSDRSPFYLVEETWQRLMGKAAGVVSRQHRPLQRWLRIHPYFGRYQFDILIHPAAGYALLGIGKMHSETTRVDVLELCGDEPDTMMRCVEQFAALRGCRPVRWPLATSDPLREVAQAQKMIPGWTFNMLARPLKGAMPMTENWRYVGTDYA